MVMRRLAAAAAAALVVAPMVPEPVAADAGEGPLSADVGQLAIALALLVVAGIVGRVVGPDRRHPGGSNGAHRPH
jgi:hypothetical protein